VQPHVLHFKLFGSRCYPTVPNRPKGNQSPKALVGVFVGYQSQQPRGWRIYLPHEEEFINTAHAQFENEKFDKQEVAKATSDDESILIIDTYGLIRESVPNKGRQSRNSFQHCSNSVSNYNDAEDAMVSSPSRDRRKEPESSKQTKSSSLTSTTLRHAAAKGSVHHTPTRLKHHSAHDEKSVVRSQQSILNAQQTLNPAYRQSKFTDLRDSIGMTNASCSVPFNTNRRSVSRVHSITRPHTLRLLPLILERPCLVRVPSMLPLIRVRPGLVHIPSPLPLIRERSDLVRLPFLLPLYPHFAALHPKRDD